MPVAGAANSVLHLTHLIKKMPYGPVGDESTLLPIVNMALLSAVCLRICAEVLDMDRPTLKLISTAHPVPVPLLKGDSVVHKGTLDWVVESCNASTAEIPYL